MNRAISSPPARNPVTRWKVSNAGFGAGPPGAEVGGICLSNVVYKASGALPIAAIPPATGTGAVSGIGMRSLTKSIRGS